MSGNATCFAPEASQKGPPLFQHGNVVFQAHDVGWLVSGFFTVIATVTSFWLINKHLQWYTNKLEQRYIIRLLLMVPIYAWISLASYLFWDNATPLLLIRDAYEAILLTAFFYLLLTYLSPDPEVQKAIFLKRGLSKVADAELRRRRQPRKKWVFPLKFVRWKPQDGLFFLQLMKWGVLQYCVVRPTTTLVAVVLNHIGLYCEQSWSPGWGHIWISTLISISVTIAMYCLLQLYLCVAEELAPHRPVLKLFAVKAVVFLTFWQATFLSVLSVTGVVKDTPYMTAEDINIGWGAVIETFEMSIFAFVHIKAFSYKPYRPLTPNPRRTPRLRSFAHAMDFRETFRELWAGSVYMWRSTRGAETDPYARRVAVLESAFDKSREQVWRERREEEKGRGLQVGKAVEVDVDGERQWLGTGDDYDYDLSRRERSEALGVVVERELEKRGYGPSGEDLEPDTDPGHQNITHEPRQRSWWRSAYERVSQHHHARDESPAASLPKRRSHSRHASEDAEQRVRVYDDQPPPSLLRTYRDNPKPGHELPPGAQSPQPPGIRTSQDVAGLPMQDRYPFLPTTRTSVTRTDSVLNRLFPNPSVRSKGNSMYSGGTSMVLTSLDTHRTHLPINAAPAVLARSVDAGRAVEISPSTLGPTSPVPRDARELHAMLSYLPIPPPLVQPTWSGLDTDSPPSPPPKSSPRPSHRRESAHYQARLAQADDAIILIPTTTSPTSTEDHSRHARSHRREPPNSLTPCYPRTSRTYETPLFVESVASPSRSWSAPGTAGPSNIFTPQPVPSRSRKRPRSKGARRTSVPVPRDNEPSPPFSSDHQRSPPSEPLAVLIPSRHLHS